MKIVLALSKSMIESNPDANLEFLTEPSEAHSMCFPGKASEWLPPAFRCEAVKICLDGQREEEESFSVAILETEPRICLSFMVEIISKF